MGKNKSLLMFDGVPLVEHMRNIIAAAGLQDTFISGVLPGYEAIPDSEPHAGPGRAVAHLLKRFSTDYRRCLFIPVDMPFMSKDILRNLIAASGNVFIKGHPMPCCLLTESRPLAAHSVKGLLEEVSATGLENSVVSDHYFLNLNTPEEWEKATTRK